MLNYRCTACAFSCRLQGTDPDLHLLQVVMACPKDPCTGKLRPSEELSPTPITALELYQALNGLGMPEERDCSEEKLRHLLIGQVVTDFKIRPVNARRMILVSMTTSSGHVFHFGSSYYGATIYKVTAAPGAAHGD